jgi:thymidylate synthase
MNNLDARYQALLQDILDNGVEKKDRTGTGTISIFGRQIRHKMSEGFPLLTTKKMAWKTMVVELLWFLRGDTNIKYLVDNNCNIWNGDAYKRYYHHKDTFGPLTMEQFVEEIKTDDEFAAKWGELGPIYGKQWRSWGGRNILNYDLQNVKWSDKDKVMELIRDGGDYSKYDVKVTYRNNSIDQIQNLINELKTNPDSRRLMVNAWNVGELDQMVLPPCHYGFQVYTRELSEEERLLLADKINKEIRQDLYTYSFNNPIYIGGIQQTDDDMRHELLNDLYIPTRAISLMWNQRSVDTFLGLPFNIASYGLLLEILAKEVNMVPDELVGNLGDVHLYSNHIEQAKEQIGRTAYELPKLNIQSAIGLYDFFEYLHVAESSDFQIENYQSHPSIKAPLSN